MGKKLIGIDIGGSKVQVGLIDSGLNLLVEKKVIIIGYNRKKILESIENIITQIQSEYYLKKEDIELIGISTPSIFNKKKDTILRTPNLPGWENFCIKDFLKPNMKLKSCLKMM